MVCVSVGRTQAPIGYLTRILSFPIGAPLSVVRIHLPAITIDNPATDVAILMMAQDCTPKPLLDFVSGRRDLLDQGQKLNLLYIYLPAYLLADTMLTYIYSP